ncbi:MAG: hypothetical protein AAGA38_10470 [Pseudomonadota bacterium]
MVGPNKILTVSYGTFSCTLEGFDDPFSTMKAIAEYFRDLASEDRFFGAEPPTPDVQMLHAIAEKASEKPVDAEIAENGLRLTQGAETTAEPAPVVTQPVEETANEDDVSVALSESEEMRAHEVLGEEPGIETPEIAEDLDTEPAPAQELDELEVEPPAADLEPVDFAEAENASEFTPQWSFEDSSDASEVEEPVSGQEETDELTPDVQANEQVAEDRALYNEDEMPEPAVADAPSFADAIRRDLSPEAEEPEVDAADAEVAALFEIEETVLDPESDETMPQREDAADYSNFAEVMPEDQSDDAPQPEATGIAAKLQRIRSVVAASVPGLSTQNDQGEDELEASDDLTDDTAFGLSIEEDQDSAAESTEGVATAALETSSEEDAEFADTDEAAWDAETSSETELFEDNAPMEPLIAFEEELEAIEKDEEIAPRHGVALELSDEDLIAAAALARPRNAPRPKAFERTIEAEQEQPDFEEPASEEAAADEPASEEHFAEDSRAEDEEAALLSDLASIEDDLAKEDAEAEMEAAAEAEAAAVVAAEEAAEARRIRAQESLGEEATGENDETVERLLSQTNSKLNDDHTQRRQSALAHLKAAVAATIADRVTPKDGETKDSEEAAVDDYRKDLASIVRPKSVDDPAGSSEGEGEAATGAKNAEIEPLVLVPQARVEPDSPVRPRRINRNEKSDMLEEQSSGFADYADEMGAKELHELLEAAAAYLSTVEGKTHFSRPEVMHMVMRHDRERTFSREAQLRSFGDLLRNGTIEKVDRGQFVISNESRFVGHG